MPVRYKIIKEHNLVLTTGAGTISFDELMAHIAQLSSDPDYKKPMKNLIDYRNVKSIRMSSSESEVYANKKADLSNIFFGEKCAIVAPTDSTYGMARIHDSLMDYFEPGIETSVFREWQEAREWLNLEYPEDDDLE